MLPKLKIIILCIACLLLAGNTHAAEEPQANVFPPYGTCKDGDAVIFRTNPMRFECKTGNGSGVPQGTVAYFALAGCPEGWALANGANGTIDVRGEFIRAWDAGRGLDPSRALGSAQGDAIRNIVGNVPGIGIHPSSQLTGAFSSTYLHSYGGRGQDNAQQILHFDASRNVPTANENRPHNVALLACQKL